MKSRRQLSNSPITESIVEYQFQPFITLNEELIANWNIKPNYVIKPVYGHQTTIQFDTSNIQQITNEEKLITSVDLINEEQGFTIKCLNDRFAVIKYRPYQNLENLKSEFDYYWQQYNESFSPSQISRIGIRSINEIELIEPLSHYVKNKVLPFWVKKTEKMESNTLLRYEEKVSLNIGIIVHIYISFITNKLIIDIDTFSTKLFNQDSLKDISKEENELRKIKNNTFYSLITSDYKAKCK
ncbi:MAG: TIGR04255 family protein [Candidatus Kapabacteria bacterium]|nr:TIGR04255 family protein [Candidatus Kapabacteria bacterium]